MTLIVSVIGDVSHLQHPLLSKLGDFKVEQQRLVYIPSAAISVPSVEQAPVSNGMESIEILFCN